MPCFSVPTELAVSLHMTRPSTPHVYSQWHHGPTRGLIFVLPIIAVSPVVPCHFCPFCPISDLELRNSPWGCVSLPKHGCCSIYDSVKLASNLPEDCTRGVRIAARMVASRIWNLQTDIITSCSSGQQLCLHGKVLLGCNVDNNTVCPNLELLREGTPCLWANWERFKDI
jgi:hypothetical protein